MLIRNELYLIIYIVKNNAIERTLIARSIVHSADTNTASYN